jgi:glycosyltransferase involved in cell wall biosynthesis
VPSTAADLRVAFVLGAASGGTASHVGALAAGCQAAGLTVASFGPAPTRHLFGAGIAWTRVQIGNRPRPIGDAAAVLRLRSGLGAMRPDVVHAHGVRAGAFAALALLGMRVPLVVTVHNAPPAGRVQALIYGVLERVCAQRADLVLCASADLLTRMRRIRAASTRAAHSSAAHSSAAHSSAAHSSAAHSSAAHSRPASSHAARVEQFDVPALPADPPGPAAIEAATAELAARGRPVVLAVGRLAPQKGLDVLVDAAVRWRDREPRPLTVIAGAGPLGAELTAQAARAGADVQLLGARQDVPALLTVADVVVVPSRWEARPLVVQEAMRAGCAIVASQVGGIPDLVGPDGAVLIPPDDSAALAAAVAAVLDDPGLAARLRRAARAHAATFPSQKDAVQAAVTIYTRLATLP